MPAIVEFPPVVKQALAQFGHLFASEPQRKQFAEYLTGLMIDQGADQARGELLHARHHQRGGRKSD